MSGTSLDGVDAALIEIEGTYTNTRIQLIESIFQPYCQDIRSNILKLSHPTTSSVDGICQMNAYLGKYYGYVVQLLLNKSKVPKEDIMFISSHGQTIYHLPEPQDTAEWNIASTLQIGDISVLAEETGLPVVGDFRPADMAAGGQGAPLMSYVDYILFQDSKKNRALQNIGGIGNVTFIPANGKEEDVISFDTGPGNMVIDAIVNKITNGMQTYDDKGLLASKGKVIPSLLNELMQHKYFSQKIPKTTGREQFDKDFIVDLWKKARSYKIKDVDLLRTVTNWTALTIADSYKQLEVQHGFKMDEVIVSGGGSRNITLLKQLQSYLPNVVIQTSTDVGINSDQKEAIGFAILGHECLNGMFNTLTSATGSSRKVIMGKVSFTQHEAYQKIKELFLADHG